jgi:NADPH:quinone reductase
MLYIDHGKGGPADVMKTAEGPMPQPQAGEVVVEVHYAGVNRPDVLQRSGSYPPPPGASSILGLEVAGRICAVAPDVAQWNIDDLVCALTPGGGYAEYCAVAAAHCLPIPKGLSLQEAAALPENFYTVWTNVFDRGRLKAGETFLVHGGSSGIGLTAIQLAKAFGATVYTTVGSKEKAEFCRKMGAKAAINYREQDFVAEVLQLTNKKGVDLILDMVGGPYIENNLKSLAPDGRLVQIAFLQGSKVTLDFLPIMIKRLTFTGSTLRPHTVAQKAAIAQDLFKHVWPLLESGTVKPVINANFPLKDAKLAHALMESSKHIGKIMLEVKS